jgi:hypothetical protein
MAQSDRAVVFDPGAQAAKEGQLHLGEEDLKQQILEFNEYFNRTMAKPFKWTYQGRPLTV